MATVKNGWYQIINAKSGTLLDLSGTDQTYIIGWRHNGGNNQEWHVHYNHENGSYTIKNHRYEKYLNSMEPRRAGVIAKGTMSICEWKISTGESGNDYRIVVPNTELHLVLTDNGSSRDGTSIAIADKSPEKNQLWKFKWIRD
ncbi:ricin B lectin domain-containing protein [Amanita rubescens]|nr:ricin B lectin domain-containing protein [Amanita rubescens]